MAQVSGSGTPPGVVDVGVGVGTGVVGVGVGVPVGVGVGVGVGDGVGLGVGVGDGVGVGVGVGVGLDVGVGVGVGVGLDVGEGVGVGATFTATPPEPGAFAGRKAGTRPTPVPPEPGAVPPTAEGASPAVSVPVPAGVAVPVPGAAPRPAGAVGATKPGAPAGATGVPWPEPACPPSARPRRGRVELKNPPRPNACAANAAALPEGGVAAFAANAAAWGGPSAVTKRLFSRTSSEIAPMAARADAEVNHLRRRCARRVEDESIAM